MVSMFWHMLTSLKEFHFSKLRTGMKNREVVLCDCSKDWKNLHLKIMTQWGNEVKKNVWFKMRLWCSIAVNCPMFQTWNDKWNYNGRNWNKSTIITLSFLEAQSWILQDSIRSNPSKDHVSNMFLDILKKQTSWNTT